MNRRVLLSVVTVLAFGWIDVWGAGALNWYASAETEKEIAASDVTTVISFADAGRLEKITTSGDITSIEQIKLPDNIDDGANGTRPMASGTKNV